MVTRTRAGLLIEQLVAELESIGSAADDLYWEQLDELMGCLGAEAANQTDEQEADQTIDEVEAWVAGNISGDGYESWVAVMLTMYGDIAGAQMIRDGIATACSSPTPGA